MRTRISWISCLVITSCIATPTNKAVAGIAYGDPTGGWKYTFHGDAAAGDDFEALDGTWEHENNSDAWDGSAIGEGLPGGVSALTEGNTTFIRIQDTGDPRDYPETGATGDPSNRKIFLDRDIIGLDDISETFLNDGFTFSFRARLSTPATGPLDPHYPDGGGGPNDWPAEGIGYVIDFDSTTNFSFYQPDTGDPDAPTSMGFALATPRPFDFAGLDTSGLLMNSLNGDLPCGDCGDTDRGELNLLEIPNLTDWHEFWITIQKAPPNSLGSHVVNVYLDGALEPVMFEVTAGTRADGGAFLTQGPMSIGMPGTVYEGAIDLDFISYIGGVVPPLPGNPCDVDGDNDCDAADIDALSQAVRNQPPPADPKFDLNKDGKVDANDRTHWVETLKKTWFGDANLDGEFNTQDFVEIFQIGEYEDQTSLNSGWAEGDWNGDGEFDSGDFVVAFQGGGFEKGPRAATSAVPEPASGALSVLAWVLVAVLRRRA